MSVDQVLAPREGFSRRPWSLQASLGALFVALTACGPKPPVASPRGMSYGVERAGQPFNAVTLVAAARGTSRTAHDVLFEGGPAPAAGSTGSTGTTGTAATANAPAARSLTLVIGLPRGEGLALVDEDAIVRDAALVVVESLVDDLRRKGFDARLDRETSLALPSAGISPDLRLSVWLDTILVRRAPHHVEAKTRLHVWARGADGTPRWEGAHALQARADQAPFDVLDALGRTAAFNIAGRLGGREAPPKRVGPSPDPTPARGRTSEQSP